MATATVEYWPAAQEVHSPWPIDEINPPGQSLHAEPANEYRPAAQSVHAAELVEPNGEYWPAAQYEQSATASWSVALVAGSAR